MRVAALALGALFALAAAALVAAEDEGISKRAQQMRPFLPRFGRPEGFPVDDEDKQEDYVRGVAILAGVFVVCAVLTLLAFIGFCISRCCVLCCKCCKPKDVYGKNERLVPLVLLLAFGTAAGIFAMVGLNENERITETLLSKDSSFTAIIPKAVNASRDKLDEIFNATGALVNSVNSTVFNVSDSVTATFNTIAGGTLALVSAIDTIGDRVAAVGNLTFQSGGGFACSQCTSFANQVNDATDELATNTDDVLNDFNSTLATIKDELTQKVNEIISDINEVRDEVRGDTSSKIDEIADVTDDMDANVRDVDVYRRGGTAGFFALPLFFLVLMVLAAFLRLGWMFKINVYLGFVVMFFVWLFCAIHIALTVVLDDGCQRLMVEQNSLLARNETAYKVMDSCLKPNVTVIDALNKSDAVDFSNKIEFPEPQNFTALLDLSALSNLTSQVGSLTLASFGFNDTAATTQLNLMNAQLGTNFNANNVTLINPNDYTGDNRTLANSTRNLFLDRATINSAIANLTTAVNNANSVRVSLTNTLNEASFNLSQLNQSITPLLDQTRGVVALANCRFAGSLYLEMRGLVCERTLGHFATITMALFFIGLFGTPIIILSQVSGTRWPRKEGALEAKTVEVSSVPLQEVPASDASGAHLLPSDLPGGSATGPEGKAVV
jgi:hypothetical protein